MTMQRVNYYEQGLAPCDAFFVTSRIERRREWAIVLDHTPIASYLSRARPNWQVFVNGVLVNSCRNHAEAAAVIQDYLDGYCWIPGWPQRLPPRRHAPRRSSPSWEDFRQVPGRGDA